MLALISWGLIMFGVGVIGYTLLPSTIRGCSHLRIVDVTTYDAERKYRDAWSLVRRRSCPQGAVPKNEVCPDCGMVRDRLDQQTARLTQRLQARKQAHERAVALYTAHRTGTTSDTDGALALADVTGGELSDPHP